MNWNDTIFNIAKSPFPVGTYAFEKTKKEEPDTHYGDESCCDHHDAKRLIGLKACDMLNIKLGKSGGIYDALKIIALAKKAKMKMAGWSIYGIKAWHTAFAHLALCSDNILHCDFDTPLMFTEDQSVVV